MSLAAPLDNNDSSQPVVVNLPALFWVAATLLTVVVASPIWLCDYFPSHNGPSLLYIAFIDFKFSDLTLGYADHYEQHPFPIPYLLYSTAVQFLLQFFDPVTAEKIWITLLVCSRPWAVIYFLRKLQPGREIYGLASFLLVYDFCLMRGYFNFYAGVSLAFVLLGYYISHREKWTIPSTIVLNLLVLLQYFTHPVALVCSGLMMAAYELAQSRSFIQIFKIVARGFIPSICLLVYYLRWASDHRAWGDSGFEYNSLYVKLKNLVERGPSPLTTEMAFLSFSLVVAIGVYAFVGLWRVPGFRPTIHPAKLRTLLRNHSIWFVFLCGWLLYLAMPWKMTGWHKADIRIIPMLFILTLALPGPIRGKRAQFAMIALISALAVVAWYPISRVMQQRSKEIVEYTHGMDHFPRNVRFLAMTHRELGDGVRIEDGFHSLQRAECYYAIGRGGAPNDCLAWNNTVYTIWYRDYRDKRYFPRVSDEPTSEEIWAAAANYGAIILWDQRNGSELPWLKAGFQVVFREKRLILLERRQAES